MSILIQTTSPDIHNEVAGENTSATGQFTGIQELNRIELNLIPLFLVSFVILKLRNNSHLFRMFLNNDHWLRIKTVRE